MYSTHRRESLGRSWGNFKGFYYTIVESSARAIWLATGRESHGANEVIYLAVARTIYDPPYPPLSLSLGRTRQSPSGITMLYRLNVTQRPGQLVQRRPSTTQLRTSLAWRSRSIAISVILRSSSWSSVSPISLNSVGLSITHP